MSTMKLLLSIWNKTLYFFLYKRCKNWRESAPYDRFIYCISNEHASGVKNSTVLVGSKGFSLASK